MRKYFLIFILIFACTKQQVVQEPIVIDPNSLAAFSPLPNAIDSALNPLSEEKIDLGRQLYFDTRFSKNQDVSCNSCHSLENYGVDNKVVSEGHKKQLGNRNSPSVYNAGGHFAQFWDGRAVDLEEQAKGPVLNPVEMAMKDEAAVLALLRSIPGYVQAFSKAFPNEVDPITYNNFGKAIGAFERKLLTPSAWDRFLQGDQQALNYEQKKGFKKFVETGCVMCHTGTYVGGGMYQKLGMIIPYPDQSDLGRFEVTKQEVDKMMFKVPSLRNVEKTGPYFHNGKVGSLNEAVKLMAKHQLGKDLSVEDVDSIVTWLKALTGDIPQNYIKKPTLPESGATTPQPDPS